MKLAITTAAVAGGILLTWFAAGCGTSSGGAGGTPQATVAGCTAYGVYAIEHHITVTQTPAACRGLSKAEVNQAAARAIMQVAGGVRKAIWRKRASEAAPFLAHLFSTPPPVTNSLPALAGSAATGPLGAKNLGMDTAALIAWLVTASSGAYVLGSWLSHGGSLRRRTGGTGAPPAVIFGHFGLALTGLVIWIVYMVAGWAALAWTAVGVLLPVAGLGMAALAIGLPGLPSLPGLAGRPVPAVAGSATAASSTGGSVAGGADTGSATGTGNTATGGPGWAASAKRRLSPLIVVGHGAVAVTTMLLVLLAALGVGLG